MHNQTPAVLDLLLYLAAYAANLSDNRSRFLQTACPSCHPIKSVNKSSAAAEMGDRATAKWAEKWCGAMPPFGGGELSPHLTQCCLERGLPPHQVASWSI